MFMIVIEECSFQIFVQQRKLKSTTLPGTLKLLSYEFLTNVNVLEGSLILELNSCNYSD